MSIVEKNHDSTKTRLNVKMNSSRFYSMYARVV